MDYPTQPDAPDGRYADRGENGQQGTIVRAAAMNMLHDELVNVVVASGQTPSNDENDQVLKAISALSSGGGLVNLAINGTLAIWQRGESFDITTDPVYTADRWQVQSDGPGGAGLGRVTRQRGATAPGVIEGAWDFLRYEALVAADAGGSEIRTKLEVLRELSDRRSTFSFLARSDTDITVTVEISQEINQTVTVLETVQVPITQGWERHAVSFDVANLVGQLAPSIRPEFLQLQIRLPNLDANTVELGRCQLEEGAAATDFEERDAALEYMLCRRYYQTSLGLGELPAVGNLSQVSIMASGSTPELFTAHRFAPEMRAVPTLTFFSGDQPGRIWWPGSTGTVGGVLANYRSKVALAPPVIVGGEPTAPSACIFNYTADAEL